MCDGPGGIDHEAVRERLRQVRALITASRERVIGLRPAWGAHLATETLARLSATIDRLENEIGLTDEMEHDASGHHAVHT